MLSAAKFAFEDTGLTYDELVNIVDNLALILRGLVSTIIQPFVTDFVLGDVFPKLIQEENMEYKLYVQRLKLTRYLPPKFYEKVIDKLLIPLMKSLSKKETLWEEILCSVIFYMREWILQIYSLVQRTGNSLKRERYLNSINRGLSAIIDFINRNALIGANLKTDVYVVHFLQILKYFDESDFNKLDSSAVLLHNSSVYHLLLSCNPFVVSELCGYVARSKTYTIIEENEVPFRSSRNSIVTDAANFLWRNQSFRYQKNSPSRAMLLPAKFIELAEGKLIINDSGIVSFEDLGSLYHNPGFAFLSAQILWKLEDSDAKITVRHLGPVSPSSVLKLRADGNETWLDLSYTQLTVHILNELDKLGLDGLADFIFSSVAGLQNERISLKDVEQV